MCVWLVALGITIPNILLKGYLYDPVICSCAVDRYKHKLYLATLACLGVAMPVIITMFCYCLIFRFIQTSHRTVVLFMGIYAKRRYKHQVRNNELDLIRSSLLIFILSIVCWVPAIIVLVFYEKGLPRIVYIIVYQGALFNSSINSLIYGKLYHRLQEGYCQLASRARKILCWWLEDRSSTQIENLAMERYS